ncbi:hypothetical protein DOJK_01326 [Patescibacteria group bacterium]|nr:hypothetical protein DOJK_01326 [Patescibacteria group bacterium]
MQALKRFFKATIAGGIVFLVPIALILVVLKQAMQFANKLAQPISEHFGLGTVAGIGAATIIATLILIFISFIAGIIADTSVGKRIMQWFENSILGGLPQYQMIKSMAEGLSQVQNATGVKPALINIEDAWQIGYLLEELEDDWVVVFLPQAPTPMSGNVMYLPKNRIRLLNISMVQAMSIVKRLGVGSSSALHGVDLTLPPAE